MKGLTMSCVTTIFGTSVRTPPDCGSTRSRPWKRKCMQGPFQAVAREEKAMARRPSKAPPSKRCAVASPAAPSTMPVALLTSSGRRASRRSYASIGEAGTRRRPQRARREAVSPAGYPGSGPAG
eukprot:754354-Prymnesium_polylepis.4